MEYTLAEYIVDSLYNFGLRNFYGVIGTSILDFIDTLYSRRDRVRFITTRHEQTALSMADAEYRVSGRLGGAVVHAGPGYLNSLLGLGVAFKDHIPIFLLSGGVRRRLYGSDAWLEIDQQRISGALTKYSARLDDPNNVDHVLGKLLRMAFTKPFGPVHLEVPEDLWLSKVDGDPSKYRNFIFKNVSNVDIADIDYIIDKFMGYEKPAILVCGEAIGKDIHIYLSEIADRLGVYILTTGNGRGACDERNYRCLGRVGFGGGNIPADKVLENSDFILVLGDELDDITTYNYVVYPRGDLVAVSENPIIEKRPVYYDNIYKYDPYIFTKMLYERIVARNVRVERPEWDMEVSSYLREWEVILNEAVNRRYENYVNPNRFFKVLDDYLDEDTIVTGGQGTHIVYTYAYLRIRGPRRFLAATNLGAMSYAFPAAMGAKVVKPDSQVLAVVGDGEFMMSIHDLETCVRENIPVKVIVVNDYSYRVLLLRQRIQKGGRIYGTLLGNPSFEELARSFGAEGYTLSSDDAIKDAIETMIKSDKPFVLDMWISREDLPPLNIEASLKMSG